MLLLFAVQALHTQAFLPRLGLEDAAESLRSPYWLAERRTVYNGIASNVGYYSLLAVAYKLFGFSLYLAKWLRLALHLFSLLALAEIFRRALGAKYALVPLLVAGLSPTWLYLNTSQAQIGIDLQLLPILLLGLLSLPLHKKASALAGILFLSMGFIWAALIYPTVLFYAPTLALAALWKWRSTEPGPAPHPALALLAAFLGLCLPVAAFLLYVKDPQLLIYDPVHKAGLFRGGGGGLTFSPAIIGANALRVFHDLFHGSGSYIFDIPYVEFYGWAGQLSASATAAGLSLLAWTLFKNQHLIPGRDRQILAWLAFSLLFLFLFPQLVKLHPGLRRTTGALFAYYGIVAFVWHAAQRWPAEVFPKFFKAALTAGVCLHLFAHALTIEKNLREGRASAAANNLSWFQLKGDPVASLNYLDSYTRSGEALFCGRFRPTLCRYAEIYGTIQANRRWNGRDETPLLGWDPELEKNRTVEIARWENHEWPH